MRCWSGSPLPLDWVAAGVKAGDHQQGMAFDNKEQRVGKTPQEGAAHVPERVGEHDRELPGVGAHAFAQSVYRVSETATQSFGLAFIPVLRMD